MPPLHPAIRTLREALRRGGFWLAVGIPPLYLPVLLAGPDLPGAHRVLATLLALNLVGLVLGHGYRAPRDRSTQPAAPRDANASHPSS